LARTSLSIFIGDTNFLELFALKGLAVPLILLTPYLTGDKGDFEADGSVLSIL